MSFCFSLAHAADFGHSRIVSALGQPLHLEIPVTGLTLQEIDSLRATPAPGQAWQEAGMTPPVPLDSMRLVLLDGYRPDVKIIQLRSDRAFDQPIVDVLLDVRSVSGQQRYQVSLVAHADTLNIQRATVAEGRNARVIDGQGALPQTGNHAAVGRQISVQRGDTMFAIAQRNAVQGVTVYQMMIALQRSNPHAFIQDNVNLVRAGSTLTMPDMDVLTALSDREARRIFLQHAQAFARYGQRGLAADVPAASTIVEADAGEVAPSESALAMPDGASTPTASGDRLRLSGATTVGSADGSAAGTGSALGGVSEEVGPLASIAALANGQAQINGQSPRPNQPPVNLLASSGAIASDALLHDAPAVVGADRDGGARFGSDAGSGGTVLSAGGYEVAGAAGGATRDPDDEAAQQKGVAESKKRILELEDNVRHLNEALQKQGHVAAEAALEGARSVTEVIKEVMSLVDPEEGEASPSPHSGTDSKEAGASLQSEATTAESDGSTATGAGHVAAEGDATAAAAIAPTGSAAPTGSPRPAESANPAASSSKGIGASIQSEPSAPPGVSKSAGAEQQSAWWKENLLALLGGGLALIILIAVWLLRRAGAADEDPFQTDNPISDSMLQEKLREIDLDLDNPPSNGPRVS